MKPDACKYLHDILEMAALIETATSGKSRDDYAADIALRHQIERELIIIGEAVVKLDEHDPETAAKIRNHSDVIGLRNILAHRYADIDNAIIWDIIQNLLPRLTREVQALLAEC